MPADAAPEGKGQRRPQDDDLEPLLGLIADGKSLRAACRELGLHAPVTHAWLDEDDGRREQYARAREGRAEHYQEQVLSFGEAAATGKPVTIDGEQVVIDPAGLRVHLEAVKWATARMAPKTAPVQRHAHSFEHLTDAELDARLAALEAARDTDADPDGEG
jgi:hypothetical protein